MATGSRLTFSLTVAVLLLFRGSAPQPTKGSRADLPSDDYYIDDDEKEEVSSRVYFTGTVQKCDYSPCVENQRPCSELSRTTNCSCPGATSPRQPPLAPSLKSVAWNGSQVVARWCAPYSYVTGYDVNVGGEQVRRFDGDRRSGALADIEHITEVCVVAVNHAGHSEASCLMYRPRDASLPLKVGLGVGAGVLLLLLLLAVLLWRRGRQRKQEAGVTAK